MAKKKIDPKVLEEARKMLRVFSNLETLERHYANFIDSYGMDVYWAVRAELIKKERRKERKLFRHEKELKKKKMTPLSKVTARSRKKRGQVLVSMPSSRRVLEKKEEEHKLPPAKIIYTPMGNKR